MEVGDRDSSGLHNGYLKQRLYLRILDFRGNSDSIFEEFHTRFSRKAGRDFRENGRGGRDVRRNPIAKTCVWLPADRGL